MGHHVQIEINRGGTGGTFTNHDILSGTVKLTTTSGLSLTYILVKLEGVAHTQLAVPDGRNKCNSDQNKYGNNKKETLCCDTHKILYDSTIVFPPENVRQASLAKVFTLAPGTYTYGFQFKIPLSNSCRKLRGITNEVVFSKNGLDAKVNNATLNGRFLVNSANNFLLGRPGSGNRQGAYTKDYHINAQLPPTLQDMKGLASIKYFVKVTCKRSSIIKPNLRAFDPFVFLPLDLSNQYGSYREGQRFEQYQETFFRKDVVFEERLPEVVGVTVPPTKALPSMPESKGSRFFSSFFASFPHSILPSSTAVAISSVDVPFAFEVRMSHPPSLSPTSTPTFKLYLVSDVDPAKYSLAKYGKPDQSNGLGIVYLQSLTFELKSVTYISVMLNDGFSKEMHQSRVDETFPLCSNTFHNLQLDLMDCKRQKSSSATTSGFTGANAYELKVPSKYYENCCLPRNLPPTFRTCNIARSYGLSVIAGVSCEKVVDSGSRREAGKKIKYVDIFCPDTQVLSGLKLTSNLHSNASGSSLGRAAETRPGITGSVCPSDHKPPLQERHSYVSVPHTTEKVPELPVRPHSVGQDNSKNAEPLLPTYDDVMRESSYQDDSEHQRARHRYGS